MYGLGKDGEDVDVLCSCHMCCVLGLAAHVAAHVAPGHTLSLRDTAADVSHVPWTAHVETGAACSVGLACCNADLNDVLCPCNMLSVGSRFQICADAVVLFQLYESCH